MWVRKIHQKWSSQEEIPKHLLPYQENVRSGEYLPENCSYQMWSDRDVEELVTEKFSRAEYWLEDGYYRPEDVLSSPFEVEAFRRERGGSVKAGHAGGAKRREQDPENKFRKM